uniref:Protein kinase domain-containing protein n=1 Tax=Bombyx mori TaxID=7091 RepID=A0A8R2AWG2_BOMMO|nr:interleukin-1 receptor-associated kinase 4 [Bombyx mori]
MERNTELRKLPMGSLYNIINILEINDSWQKVMAWIPTNPQSDHFHRKYNSEHLRMIQDDAKISKRTCSEILFDEWSTSGRIRPTVATLLDVLVKAEIYRAADEIANILGEPLPPRPLEGPAAKIDTNVTFMLNGESMPLDGSDVNLKDNQNLDTKNTNQHPDLHNRTTKQLKSADPLIIFSNDNISNGPKDSKSFGHKTTAQVISYERNSAYRSTLRTEELPNISALMGTSVNSSQSYGTTQSTELKETRRSLSSNNISILSDDSMRSVIDSKILEDENLISFDYNQLAAITNNFSEDLNEGQTGLSGKIGGGGFGEVFVGTHNRYGQLAVKKVKCYLQFNYKHDVAIRLFNAEVKSLSQLRHKNIVPIFGYSIDGPTPCIVCKYIDGGSLMEKIAAKVLNENQRLEIISGTAEGLKYVHNTVKPIEVNGDVSPITTFYIHGDVKSANILLTKDCKPMLCDFGLAKQLESTRVTSMMMGTSAYMPPEAIKGTLTKKTDVYSFGIVLLELLTGLKPIVVDSNGNLNIKDYVEQVMNENKDITQLLDMVVERWTRAQGIYELAKRCLSDNRDNRPSIDEVCETLEKMINQESYEILYAHV